VDVTIILGRFTIDSSVHSKMLLLRYSGMQANVHYSVQRRNQIAKELYHCLRPIAGRQGYEMGRRGGSSGKISNQSDQDLLDCIHDVPGLCPRRLPNIWYTRIWSLPSLSATNICPLKRGVHSKCHQLYYIVIRWFVNLRTSRWWR
jgi:hypothetical protein